MSIRPWVVVEPPDSRGLREISINGRTVGSVWSVRELRSALGRLGYPEDMDLEDPASVSWRGGDSTAWPARAWRRRLVMALAMVGLFASMVLHVVIGWPDVFGAQTFAQRMAGILFILAGAVQGAAICAVLDYWGRRPSKVSGALVLIGVLTTLATTSLLLFLWLQEREFTPYLLLFLPLWCWSIWALRILVHEKIWKHVPYPKKFAAGVTITGLLTSISLGYSMLYQPSSAPVNLTLNVEFGKPQTDSTLPYFHIPLRLRAKNEGSVPLYIVNDDFTIYGNSAKFSEVGKGMKEWTHDSETLGDVADAELFERKHESEVLTTGYFRGPGFEMSAGQETVWEKFITVPKNSNYETLEAVLGVDFMRKDRGQVNEEFAIPRYS
ncbi:hypothetical protein P1P68_17580 [Streptomyces scabiei]|uniref:hypothetical protein n=1 Tax=Streptomyces scabiei TaxID=1930 RepID=UPI00298F4C96|nr:hypothetical protein [Streptomyces scabiei]MDW8806552.1 hypothetical protein [Streptomyces scabiei]